MLALLALYAAMPNLSVRNLSETSYAGLRRRAAANDRSMEAEVRFILEKAASEPPYDAKAFAAELRRRRLERSDGKIWPDSTPDIREDRETR